MIHPDYISEDVKNIRAESSDGGTAGIQPDRGGSIPTSALFWFAGMIEEAQRLIIAHHYSGCMPSNVIHVGTMHEPGGLFGNRGTCVAAVVFSFPQAKWEHTPLELSRLVRIPDLRPPLTKLVALSVRTLKKMDVPRVVISYADATQGHHGGIYQACGWHYDGQRESVSDGLIIDGQFTPGRTCNAMFGTRSCDKLKQMFPNKIISDHRDAGKHLYWLALNQDGERQASAMKLAKRKYPKPNTDPRPVEVQGSLL